MNMRTSNHTVHPCINSGPVSRSNYNINSPLVARPSVSCLQWIPLSVTKIHDINSVFICEWKIIVFKNCSCCYCRCPSNWSSMAVTFFCIFCWRILYDSVCIYYHSVLTHWPCEDLKKVLKLKLSYVIFEYHIDGLVQESRNSIALAMELRLSCTNPSICFAFLFNLFRNAHQRISGQHWFRL